MSAMPWGTMNGWLRLETEQRGTWVQQRVQDLRAVQVVTRAELADQRTTPKAAPEECLPSGMLGCPEAA